MARTAIFSDEGESDSVSLQDTSRNTFMPSGRNARNSPSPSVSFSSDKENRPNAGANGRQKSVAPPNAQSADISSRPNRKRKLADRDTPANAPRAHQQEQLEKVTDKRHYDPEQSLEERRELRKDYRDLHKGLTDSRTELMTSDRGIIELVERSNELYTSVKQTSDATLDSRFLVSAADLSMKRTTQLNLGDSNTGIDVDDFVSKCITFMRNSQRRNRAGGDSDDEANPGYDDGDAFDWGYLGRKACLPCSLRPSVPGFLLGPLSVQKRARKATQRRARLPKHDPRNVVRPEELKELDVEQSKRSNLKDICTTVQKNLVEHSSRAAARVEEEVTDEMSDGDIQRLMRRHRIADNGGVPLFDFVVNPKSFGQTVENLFYVSFLIKEGRISIDSDGNTLPTLLPTSSRTPEEQMQQNIQKHQAIFHLDFDTWDGIIDLFDIKQSIIPHRQPDPSAQHGGKSWYG